MKYAVSTHSFLMIVEFDRDWRVTSHELLNTGYHFGMTTMARPAGRELVVYHDTRSTSREPQPCLLTYRLDDGAIREVNREALSAGDWGDVHQITTANGGMYLTNTKYNSLVFRDPASGIHHEYRVENRTNDYNHVNSVFPCGQEIIVMLHNRSHKVSELAVLGHDRARGFELRHTLSLWNMGCHNLFLDDGTLLYNASRRHALMVVDLKKDRISRTLPLHCEHNKGLSITREHMVIGLSEHAPRGKRATSKGRLAVLARPSLEMLTIVDLNLPSLPHPIGNINEVRCLSEPELAAARATDGEVDWQRLRLGRKNPMMHAARRLFIAALKPMRKVKTLLQTKRKRR